MKKLRIKLARWIAPKGYSPSPTMEFIVEAGKSVPILQDEFTNDPDRSPADLMREVREAMKHE